MKHLLTNEQRKILIRFRSLFNIRKEWGVNMAHVKDDVDISSLRERWQQLPLVAGNVLDHNKYLDEHKKFLNEEVRQVVIDNRKWLEDRDLWNIK